MSGAIHVLFFASLADQLNCRSLTLPYPPAPVSVADLKKMLVNQNGADWCVLHSVQIRCAVNQEIVRAEHLVKAGDEVAFFPPVTGG